MTLEGSFSGEMEYDADRGFTGGACVLKLAGGAFELGIQLGYIYSIDEGHTLRGTYSVGDDGVTLDAREHYSYTWETVKQETTRAVSRRLAATFAGPEGHRCDVLEMALPEFDSPAPLLLRRQEKETAEP
jgi:hypothetical protein